MANARFIGSSSGEITQNVELTELTVISSEANWRHLERGRVDLRRAEFRIVRGLLLEAGPSEADDDKSLVDLPTGVFNIIAAESDDKARMERISAERQRRKEEETEAERKRLEET
jgi:hypothetical protein